jgi:hypothetical protein
MDALSGQVRMLFSQIESDSCKEGNRMQIAGSSAIVGLDGALRFPIK